MQNRVGVEVEEEVERKVEEVVEKDRLNKIRVVVENEVVEKQEQKNRYKSSSIRSKRKKLKIQEIKIQ